MRTLLVHIGAHKTGTTAIQQSCDMRRRALRKVGVIYPRCNWYHHAQHRLAFAMRGTRDPATGDIPDLSQELTALNMAIAAAPQDARILVSSEAFFAAPFTTISRLRDGIAGADIRIIAVIRRPDDLFLSIYNQNVKSPWNNFRSKINCFTSAPATLHPDLDPCGCVGNWVRVFGQKRVLLHRYEDMTPVAMMQNVLGLPPGMLGTPKTVNKSVPAAVAEIMRLSKVTGIAPELRHDLYTLANRIFAGEEKLTLSPMERRKMLAQFRPDLDALFAQFGMENTYLPETVPEDMPDAPALKPVILLARVLEHLLAERRAL